MASHMSETAAIPAHPSRIAETAVPSFGSNAPRSPDRLDRDRQNDARKVPDFLWRSAAIAPVSCGYGSRSETDKIYVPAPAGETRSDFPPSSTPHPGSGCFLPSGMSQTGSTSADRDKSEVRVHLQGRSAHPLSDRYTPDWNKCKIPPEAPSAAPVLLPAPQAVHHTAPCAPKFHTPFPVYLFPLFTVMQNCL